MPAPFAKLLRAARVAWRIARVPLIPVLVMGVLAVQIAIVAVLTPLPSSTFAPGGGPLVILDRHGEVIATVPAGTPDRDHWVPLSEIPAIAVSAVIASEDEGFWDHRGVDGEGLLRATWLDLRGGGLHYGGSTLTMQLARILRGTTAERSVGNKIEETVMALRIERALGKREILEQWFNRAYFGNHCFGIDAAARFYFGKPAAALSTGEAVLLAVLPRAPGAYDPLTHLDAATGRRDRVLDMLVARGVLAAGDGDAAKRSQLAPTRHDPASQAPHFVRWVLDNLPAEQRAAGGVVHTSLDLGLQRLLEQRLADHVAGMASQNLQQAGMVVLDTQTSEVLAMIGSADWDGTAGEINITTRRRHPGSSLKPFIYGAAIEAGDNPASIAMDVIDASPDYFVPGETHEHGPVRYREALASSYNFAAVWTLEHVGLTRVMTALRQAGVAELSGAPDDYGPRLALGAPKVRLLDLAAGYGFLVRGGLVRPAGGVTSIDHEDGTRWEPPAPEEHQVFSPETSWLVMDMMSDPEARRPAFGTELPFDLPFKVAAKTGTSRGFEDTVAIAATSEVIVAAWAGNFDGQPTQGVIAMHGAAPLVRDGLLAVSNGKNLTLPARPDDIEEVDVCAISGMKPGPDCPHKHEFVKKGQGPTDTCTWHVRNPDGSVTINWPSAAGGWIKRQAARH